MSKRIGFMDLPGEVRNRIYEFALFPTQREMLVVYASHENEIRSRLFFSPLFQANSRIRHEAMSYFCANKAFRCADIGTAVRLFSFVKDHILQIKEFTLCLKGLPLFSPAYVKHGWTTESWYTSVFWDFVKKMKRLRIFRMELRRLPPHNGLDRDYFYGINSMREQWDRDGVFYEIKRLR